MQEIVPDVVSWSRLSERHGYYFNGHLVRHPEGNSPVPEPGLGPALSALFFREAIWRTSKMS
jgi:hypothetical protein